MNTLDDTDTVVNSRVEGARTHVYIDVDGSRAWATHTMVWDADGDPVSSDFA